jgi:hypothetical protein
MPVAATNPRPVRCVLSRGASVIAEAHALAVAEAPWVWIVHDLNPRAVSAKVKGFHPAQSWSQDFTSITME